MKAQKFFNFIIVLTFGFSILGIPTSSALAQAPTAITVTNNNDSGPGSLRHAIADANPGDFIIFDQPWYNIHLASPLIFDKDITIYGYSTWNGDTDGDGIGDVRIMEVRSGATVNINDTVIKLGLSDHGGAILNYGTLGLRQVWLEYNHATDSGGAIYNEGLLGLYTMGMAHNDATNGGAIYNAASGKIWIRDDFYYYNSAANEGGVIDNWGYLETNRVSFESNNAVFGGAIHNHGEIIMYNNIIAFNEATQSGGGLYDLGTSTIIHTTFSDNLAPNGASIFDAPSGSTTLKNTIVATGMGITTGDNCSGWNIVGDNYNISWPDTSCPGRNADPILILGNVWGAFPAYWFLDTGSAAINTADDAVCAIIPDPGPLDKRGIPRPQGSHCDIGAFEKEQPANQAPVLFEFTAPIAPVQVGESINAAVTFSDPDVGDTYIVTWNWGDDSTTAEPATVPLVTTSHTYTSSGVYTVTATITDAAGESDTESFQYIVIYDPNGGFITGGGWINSPLGAYTPDPSLTDKATFGFVSKYQRGANVPTGSTEFQFHVANMEFKSTSYDWLVIAGTKAQYKGTGTINGAGEYNFLLTAIDGSPDKFRIKIWDEGDVIYDNMLGTADMVDPNMVIQVGSIVIHKLK